MSSVQDDGKWASIGIRLTLSTIGYPVEYAKTLIQLGHEPMRPYATRRLFGKPAMCLPGVFQYVRHINKVDGLSGCYRGVSLRLCSLAVQSFTHTHVLEVLKDEEPRTATEEWPEEEWRQLKTKTRNELAARVVATVVSHPIHVCVVRCMAQFVGKETKYVGIVSCIRETYEQSGFAGFFSGLVPRILAEAFQLLIASSLAYFVNAYLLKDDDHRQYSILGTNFIASTITYPFLLVSNCMIVSGCGLAAGYPPNMPVFTSWTNCFSHLYSKGQLKRGSSLIFRYVS